MLPWMKALVQLYASLRKSAELLAILAVLWFKRLKLQYNSIHYYKKLGYSVKVFSGSHMSNKQQPRL